MTMSFKIQFLALLFAMISTAAAVATDDGRIVLEDFSHVQHEWIEMNDPVMGGKSTGHFSAEDGVGHFQGEVAIVPFLQAPGFIKAETKATINWPDVSNCQGLELTLQTSTPEYAGYRVSFGHKKPPNAFPYSYGFKTDLKLPPAPYKQEEMMTVKKLPFGSFTDSWDAATGDAIVTCAQDPQYCPDQETLQHDLYSIAIWAEGVVGKVDVKLSMIAAYGCDADNAKPSQDENIKTNNDNDNEEDEIVIEDFSDPIAKPSQDENIKTNNDNDNDEDEIVIEDFSDPINTWRAMNDPVMGGESRGTVSMENGAAVFDGKVVNVPFLQAPGFITMVTGKGFGHDEEPGSFPDVSSCSAFELVLKSDTTYDGYRFSFGTAHAPNGRYAYGYKAPALTNVPYQEFGTLLLPFASFSDKWDDATGDILVSCDVDNPEVCPTTEALQDLQTISIWGEGVAGSVHLEIKSISAVGCGQMMVQKNSIETAATTIMAATIVSNDTSTASSSGNFIMGSTGLSFLMLASVLFAVRLFRRQEKKSHYQEVSSTSTTTGLQLV